MVDVTPLVWNPFEKNLIDGVNDVEDLKARLIELRNAYDKLVLESPDSDIVSQIRSEINQIENAIDAKTVEVIATKSLYDNASNVPLIWGAKPAETLPEIYRDKQKSLWEITDYMRKNYGDMIKSQEEKSKLTQDAIANARAGEAAIASANLNRAGLSTTVGRQAQNEMFLKTQEALAQQSMANEQQKATLMDAQLAKELNLYTLGSADYDNYKRQEALDLAAEREAKKQFQRQLALQRSSGSQVERYNAGPETPTPTSITLTDEQKEVLKWMTEEQREAALKEYKAHKAAEIRRERGELLWPISNPIAQSLTPF